MPSSRAERHLAVWPGVTHHAPSHNPEIDERPRDKVESADQHAEIPPVATPGAVSHARAPTHTV